MEVYFVVALKHLRQFFSECRIGMQTRDFIFILVSHEFIEILCHRLGQTQRQIRIDHSCFGESNLFNEVAVLLGVGGVLILRQ